MDAFRKLQIMHRVRTVQARLVEPVRRGQRRVLWTPTHKMGLGNFLYFWLWADMEQYMGVDARVRRTPDMEATVQVFPEAAAALTIDPAAVRFTDQRRVEWPQRYGTDFVEADLDRFVSRWLLGSENLKNAIASAPIGGPETVVINVRRGDYYSVPRIRGNYAIDLTSYLRVAVAGAADEGSIERFLVVSDGPDWCRARLGWLHEYAPAVDFMGPDEGMLANFAAVTGARRSVLTNSSFSYWAGYGADVLHQRSNSVWAPRFHARNLRPDGMAIQLAPTWRVVQDIPGGWDS